MADGPELSKTTELENCDPQSRTLSAREKGGRWRTQLRAGRRGWSSLRQNSISYDGYSHGTSGRGEKDHGKASSGSIYQILRWSQSRTSWMGCKWARKIGRIRAWRGFSWIEVTKRIENALFVENGNWKEECRPEEKRKIRVGIKPFTIKRNLHSPSSILFYHSVY